MKCVALCLAFLVLVQNTPAEDINSKLIHSENNEQEHFDNDNIQEFGTQYDRNEEESQAYKINYNGDPNKLYKVKIRRGNSKPYTIIHKRIKEAGDESKISPKNAINAFKNGYYEDISNEDSGAAINSNTVSNFDNNQITKRHKYKITFRKKTKPKDYKVNTSKLSTNDKMYGRYSHDGDAVDNNVVVETSMHQIKTKPIKNTSARINDSEDTSIEQKYYSPEGSHSFNNGKSETYKTISRVESEGTENYENEQRFSFHETGKGLKVERLNSKLTKGQSMFIPETDLLNTKQNSDILKTGDNLAETNEKYDASDETYSFKDGKSITKKSRPIVEQENSSYIQGSSFHDSKRELEIERKNFKTMEDQSTSIHNTHLLKAKQKPVDLKPLLRLENNITETKNDDVLETIPVVRSSDDIANGKLSSNIKSQEIFIPATAFIIGTNDYNVTKETQDSLQSKNTFENGLKLPTKGNVDVPSRSISIESITHGTFISPIEVIPIEKSTKTYTDHLGILNITGNIKRKTFGPDGTVNLKSDQDGLKQGKILTIVNQKENEKVEHKGKNAEIINISIENIIKQEKNRNDGFKNKLHKPIMDKIGSKNEIVHNEFDNKITENQDLEPISNLSEIQDYADLDNRHPKNDIENINVKEIAHISADTPHYSDKSDSHANSDQLTNLIHNLKPGIEWIEENESDPRKFSQSTDSSQIARNNAYKNNWLVKMLIGATSKQTEQNKPTNGLRAYELEPAEAGVCDIVKQYRNLFNIGDNLKKLGFHEVSVEAKRIIKLFKIFNDIIQDAESNFKKIVEAFIDFVKSYVSYYAFDNADVNSAESVKTQSDYDISNQNVKKSLEGSKAINNSDDIDDIAYVKVDALATPFMKEETGVDGFLKYKPTDFTDNFTKITKTWFDGQSRKELDETVKLELLSGKKARPEISQTKIISIPTTNWMLDVDNKSLQPSSSDLNTPTDGKRIFIKNLLNKKELPEIKSSESFENLESAEYVTKSTPTGLRRANKLQLGEGSESKFENFDVKAIETDSTSVNSVSVADNIEQNTPAVEINKENIINLSTDFAKTEDLDLELNDSTENADSKHDHLLRILKDIIVYLNSYKLPTRVIQRLIYKLLKPVLKRVKSQMGCRNSFSSYKVKLKNDINTLLKHNGQNSIKTYSAKDLYLVLHSSQMKQLLNEIYVSHYSY